VSRRTLRCIVYGFVAAAGWCAGSALSGQIAPNALTLMMSLALGAGIALYQERRG